jgi:DNA repair photolyase
MNLSEIAPTTTLAGMWDTPATIKRNHFIHKSLSSWAFNGSVGCGHGCGFCSVPDTSTNKLKHLLAAYGVRDPSNEWGSYQFPRPWDEKAFIASLHRADSIPSHELNGDGNRCVFFSSTSDPFPTIRIPDRGKRKGLQQHARFIVRRALELIHEHSTLNVRILTRSPRAMLEIDLFRKFGDRLLLGVSLPTLNIRLAKAYEGHSPAPTHRLKMLHQAKEAGIHRYAAVAPFFPESTRDDLRKTFEALAAVDPVTVFFEPINIRLGNVVRMKDAAERAGVSLRLDVFRSPSAWREYALESLHMAEEVAKETGLAGRLHLWPDPVLGSVSAVLAQPDPGAYTDWLQSWWSRISEWPGNGR